MTGLFDSMRVSMAALDFLAWLAVVAFVAALAGFLLGWWARGRSTR